MSLPELTPEELMRLMEIAATPSTTPEPVQLGPVEEFVVACGIKEGDAKIIPYMLWYTYTQWAKHPIRQDTFFKGFAKLFKPHRWGQKRFYCLDPAPFDLSLDTYWKVRAQLRQTKERRKREKERAKQEYET